MLYYNTLGMQEISLAELINDKKSDPSTLIELKNAGVSVWKMAGPWNFIFASRRRDRDTDRSERRRENNYSENGARSPRPRRVVQRSKKPLLCRLRPTESVN